MKKEKLRLLLVEDDFNLGFVLQDYLTQHGYKVDLEKDGQAGFQAFYQKYYDLCILDVMLPKKDGFSLAEDIRKVDQKIPILFLTAKTLTEDKIEGFKKGGDDYMTKPFNSEELLLRLEAILKRVNRDQDADPRKDLFQLGNFSFDYNNLRLTIDGQEKGLTKKEAELLRLLCLHENEVLSREMALTIVWGTDDYFLGRSMDVFITKLRKYLKPDPRIKIMNVHGVGFKLIVNQA